MPSAELHATYREQRRRSLRPTRDPRTFADAVVRRLDEQLERIRHLYEFREYDWDAFLAKRAEIHEEHQRLREQVTASATDLPPPLSALRRLERGSDG